MRLSFGTEIIIFKHFIFMITNIKFSITNRINKIDGSIICVDIDFIPVNYVLSSCITQVRINNYPEFVFKISNNISIDYEHVHFYFFRDCDWEDQDLAEYMVGRKVKEKEILLRHTVMGATIIDEILFDRILNDYALKLLEVYGKDQSIQKKYEDYYNWYKPENGFFKENPNWSLAMKTALEKLKEKISDS